MLRHYLKQPKSKYLFIFLFSIIFAVIFLLPIFSPGPILTLDNVATPVLAKNVWGLFSLNSVLLQKLFLFTAIGVAVAGICINLLELEIISWLTAIVFLTGSPFFLERLAIGQWHILLAVGLLLWSIYFFRKVNAESQRQKILYTLLALFFAWLSFDIYHRAISFLEIVTFSGMIVWIYNGKKGAFALARFLLCLSLVITAILTVDLLARNFSHILIKMARGEGALFFPLGEGEIWQKFVGIFGYIGFWAEKAQRVPVNFQSAWHWYLLGIAWFILAIPGAIFVWKKNNNLFLFLLIQYILSFIVVLSGASNIPEQKLFKMYDLFGLIGLRETGKFMGLMAISQSIMLGYTVNLISKKINTTKTKYQMMAILLSFCVIANFALIGFHTYISISPNQIPPSILEYAQKANQENKKVIIFPWHRYQSYSFTQGKVIDQLGLSLFNLYVFNEAVEYNGVITNSPEDWQQQIATATETELNADLLHKMLKEREVNKILIFKTNDFQRYIDWAENENFTKEIENSEFASYNFQ